jgi:hypothetical protein
VIFIVREWRLGRPFSLGFDTWVLEPLFAAFCMRWLHEQTRDLQKEGEKRFLSLDVQELDSWQATGYATGIGSLRSNRYVSAEGRIDLQDEREGIQGSWTQQNAKLGEDCKLITLFDNNAVRNSVCLTTLLSV